MSVTQRQFNYLNAMGIELWQRKSLNNEPEQAAITDADHDLPAVSVKQLLTHQLVHDLLLAIDANIEQLSQQTSFQLSLADLTWQFSIEDTISLTDGVLTTPSIENLLAKPELKKALWQLLQTIQPVSN